MKTKLLSALLLCGFALAACAHTRKVKSRKTTSASSAHTVTSLRMHRTACFGRCPTYEIVVSSNGMVEYRGKRFTNYSGVYQKNMGKAATDLLAQYSAKRIDTCRDMYEKMIPDLPGIWYYYTIGGKERQVGNADSGPMWLKVMSSQVDSLAKVDATWKKISDSIPE